MDRMFRWGCLGAFLLAIIIAVLAIVLGRESKVFTPPDTLVLYLPGNPEILNPIIGSDSYESEIDRFVMDSMITRDFKDPNIFLPRLATSWEISEDHLTYTFHLRRGVRWHDGAPFTSADVIYSMGLIMDPAIAPHLRVYYEDLDTYKAPDDYTVVFKMKKPYYAALDSLGSMPIVPRHIFDDGKTDFKKNPNNEHPIGTGEYKFVEWIKDQSIVLERNEDFYGAKPNFKRIIYRIITNENAALAIFKKGEIDALGLTTFQWIRQTSSPRFDAVAYKITYDNAAYSYIGWNLRLPMFSDKQVRKALTMLIDRAGILKEIYFGLGVVISGPFFYKSPSSDPSIKPLPYDPKAAAELLDQAGWSDHDGDGVRDKDGVKFQFTFLLPAGNPNGEKIVRIVKESLEKNGIIVNVRQVEWATFLGFLDQWDFGACMLGWSLGWDDDPYQLWHSSQADVHESSNYVGFKNAEADKIIEDARVTFDDAKRTAMYRRFHQIISDEQPYTFLFSRMSLMAVNRRMENVNTYPIRPGFDIREWTWKGMTPRAVSEP